MYGLGEKVIAKSKDVCSYKTKSNCMDKINLNEVIESVEKLALQKITLVITAFKEPNIGRAIEAALNQRTSVNYNVVVSAPDDETIEIVKDYAEEDERVSIFRDPGKGKSYALNLLFKEIDTDILVLTDGDVLISENSIEEIYKTFLDPEVGCFTGKPVPIEDRKIKYGYWANFLFDAAHKIRKDAHKRNAFIECSGYLFGFRKKKIDSIPLDVAEDSVIPYYFWEKGYKIAYVEEAEVYVKNVDNWRDWIKQKARTSKAHETLDKYVDVKTTERVKSFGNEAKGVKMLFDYPKNILEAIWTVELMIARLYMWYGVFLDTKIKGKNYGDAWERVESTK